ncbi:hypothetical protein [Legionella cardiaca]|uniref:Regulator of chromosome condensation (RCC1) repeat protein n=1 Tax=Legionella cardiaca TaxID=1071983 RepID=A0ABY8AVJ1_9GAMM|nr:hypothetical protein [Legionella cardiaca]WED44171.1 hypothetical protein PXX05_05120 [Legionella cardiaca]
MIANGNGYSLCLDANGVVYSFGWKMRTEIGLQKDQMKKGKNFLFTPEPISFHDNAIFMTIAAGDHYALYLTETGDIYVNFDENMMNQQDSNFKKDLGKVIFSSFSASNNSKLDSRLAT